MLTANTALYVPELPTLAPSMLLGPSRAGRFPPFAGGRVHWYYFARNAVWNAVRLLGLEGREILMPAYHHGVEVEALLHAGAQLRFYRVDRQWQVDLDDLERRIGPHTRALYLIHYAGFPGPSRAMREIADRHGLYLIEDCALSLLSADAGTPLGSHGDFAVFCLYKTLPVPNGGALLFNHNLAVQQTELSPPPLPSMLSHATSSVLKRLAMRGGHVGQALRHAVRRLTHGAVRASGVERVATGTMHFDPNHVQLGISPLSLRIAAALDLDAIVAARRHNYLALRDALGALAPPLFSELDDGVCPLFYPLLCANKAELLAQLRAAGIEAVDFWRDHHPACPIDAFPDVAWLRERVVEIPCHQDLDAALLARMAAVVRAARPQLAPACA